jgi:DNA repair protein RadC
MPRKKFSYVDPHYCRVMMVKDAPIALADPLKGPAGLAAIVATHVRDLPREAVYSVPLDSRRRPLAVVQVSVGTLTQSLAHPREVFQPVFLVNGAAVALAVLHNHPSGDPSPSPDDHALTRRLREAAEILGIPLVDHIIVGADGKFFSYADSGWPSR